MNPSGRTEVIGSGSKLIPLSEVARQLGRKYNTVRNWTIRGCNGRILWSRKIGGTVYTSGEAIEQFSEETPAAPVPQQRTKLATTHKEAFAKKFAK